MDTITKKELFDKIQKPLENLYNDVSGTFAKIAKNLFNNFCIKCGDDLFYFAEIEFYYYDSKMYLQNKDLYKWQKVTYVRNNKNVGDFLYHLSGIDICFASSFNNDNAIFGGILIRSIKNKEGKIVAAGPYTCRDFILNKCDEGEKIMPTLSVYKSQKEKEITPTPFRRTLGKTDMENKIDSTLELCFYDCHLDWTNTSEKEDYDKEKGKIKPYLKNYSKRFQ